MQKDKIQFDDLAIRFLSGRATESEEALLVQMIELTPSYKIRFSEIAHIRAVSSTKDIEAGRQDNFNKLSARLRADESKYRYKYFLNSFIRIAAIVLVVVAAGIVTNSLLTTSYNPPMEVVMNQMIVPFGSQAKTILSDGTVVWLNSGSILKYSDHFGDKSREVSLSGEGYFEVVSDLQRPFFVNTEDLCIKVLGTSFNVSSYRNDFITEINLVEGKVDVYNKHDKDEYSLLPDEKLVYLKNTNNTSVYKVNAANATLWTTGQLSLVDATLEDISNSLERKFDVQISIETDKIKNEMFSGTLDLNQSLMAILDYIDVDKKYDITQVGKRVSIRDK